MYEDAGANWDSTVVAEIITELIQFELEICICNGN